MQFNTLFSNRSALVRLTSVIQKRYRHKEKWANTRPKKTSCDLALEHFDTYYKPVYGSRWPSIRIALLSQPKYCALVNNFAVDRNEVVLGLAELGAHDVIRKARDAAPTKDGRAGLSVQPDLEKDMHGSEDVQGTDVDRQRAPSTTAEEPDIDTFMPVKKIRSEKEQLRDDDVMQNIYKESPDLPVKVVDAGKIRIPFDLMAFAQDAGDVSIFPPAKKDVTDKLSYYLMDAASLLPVVALGLEPDCTVLDLCAAPGGKSLAILQTLLPAQLTCVDRSYSRLKRLGDVLRWYTPKSYVSEGKVKLVHQDGINFVAKSITENSQFDRVLVDVPCFADRHSLSEEDNNLFRPSRLSERLELQGQQKDLLFAGIKSCRPGGVVVYSTCTMAPVQNDGVVAATLERVWQETDMDYVVENLHTTTDLFASTFHFHEGSVGSRFGSIVLPNLTANFGPMYFCRLRRIR